MVYYSYEMICSAPVCTQIYFVRNWGFHFSRHILETLVCDVDELRNIDMTDHLMSHKYVYYDGDI